MTNVAVAAARMIERGCAIFPVDYPLDDKCSGVPKEAHTNCEREKRGKHSTTKYTQRATKDPSVVAAITNPMRNYGIYTKDSDLIVLDEDDVGALKRLADGRELPVTFTVVTHDGRKHYYFSAGGLVRGNSDLVPGINVRAHADGYVVGPGSLHHSGAVYEPENWEAPFADVPGWLRELLAETDKPVDRGEPVGAEKPTADQHALWKPEVLAAFALKKDVVKSGESLGGKGDGLTEAFYYFVRRFKEMGMSQGNAVFYLDSWCKDKDKYWSPYRVPGEVARIWVNAPEYKIPLTSGPLVTVRLSDRIKHIKRVRWLVKGLIPVGELTVLGGEGGVGKSTIAVMYGAQCSTGELTADVTKPGVVLWLTIEEDIDSALAPKFLVAGADMDNIVVLKGKKATVGEGISAISLPDDIPMLEEEFKNHKPVMLVIDPLTSFVDAKKSENANKEMRSALEPLVDLAHRYKVAIVGIAHLNKNTSVSANHRILGSVGIPNLSRSVVMCIKDPETGDRFMGQTKGNLTAHADSSTSYTIELVDIDPEEWGIEDYDNPEPTPRAVLGAVEDRNIETLMMELGTRGRGGGNRGGRPDHEKNAAIMWLLTFLRRHGEAAKTDIEEAAVAEGHAARTVQRALTDARFEKAGRSFGASQRYKLRSDAPQERQDVPTWDEVMGET